MKLNIQLFAGGTISKTSGPSVGDIRILWSSEDDVENNRSTVTAQVQMKRASSGSTTGTLSGTVTIDGTNYNISRYGTWPSGTWYQIGTKEKVVNHNDDGSKKITISSSLSNTGTTMAGTYKASASVSLDTIPRATKLAEMVLDIGFDYLIPLNRALSTFTHNVKYTFDNETYYDIAEGVENAFGWYVPTSLYARAIDTALLPTYIYIETYDGNGSLIGTTSNPITLRCKESVCKPELTTSVVDTNPLSLALTGDETKFILDYSNAKVSFTKEFKNLATFKTLTSNGVDVLSTQENITINNINIPTVTSILTDSRNFTDTKINELTTIPYSKLNGKASFKRLSATSNTIRISYSGAYFNGSFGVQSNVLTLGYSYRIKNGEWSEVFPIEYVAPISLEQEYSGQFDIPQELDYRDIFEVRFHFADKLDSDYSQGTVLRGYPLWWWNKLKFVFKTDVYDRNNKLIEGYNIGDVKITSTNVSPDGDKWELIDKEFAYATHAENYSNSNASFEVRVIRGGKTVRIRIKVTVSRTIGDATIDLVNWASWLETRFGVTELPYGHLSSLGASDGGNAVVFYDFEHTGLLSTTDTVPVDINSGDNFYTDDIWICNPNNMIDSFCDKFYWKKVS